MLQFAVHYVNDVAIPETISTGCFCVVNGSRLQHAQKILTSKLVTICDLPLRENLTSCTYFETLRTPQTLLSPHQVHTA